MGGKVGNRNGEICHCVKRIEINKIKGISSGRSILHTKITPELPIIVLTLATFLKPERNV
ncbi:hypothetical protein EJK17_10925 [Lactobacillus xujianguonis]|uniref:Uncharacterized protein n=1 Tax=Lactobacillus xujianguonis TaxID=2495899 RepID=A0A437SSD4_9LACO|nr:hypothetical protein EJK17_10925 [Lactobacillus xujianguonis]RVU71926.1 hypothetical protein EJK20_11245 [Lactobacillus xujianguonis]